MKMETYPVRHQQRKGKHGKAISDLQSPEGIEADGHSTYEAQQRHYDQSPCCGLLLSQHTQRCHGSQLVIRAHK
jgi:hypothetical protein